MRKAMLLVAVFGLAGTLWAADPIIGTWKMNIAKSKFPPTEKAPREQYETYRELSSGQTELTMSGVEADGSRFSSKWTWPRQGGIAKSSDPIPKEITYIEAVIEPYNYCVIVLRDGKQVGRMNKTIDKDGRTMRQTHKGFDDKGNPSERLWFYEKQ